MRDIVAMYERESQPAIYAEPSIEGDIREQMMKYRDAQPEIRGDRVVVSLFYSQGCALPKLSTLVETEAFFGGSREDFKSEVVEPVARKICRALDKASPELPVTTYTIGIGFAEYEQ